MRNIGCALLISLASIAETSWAIEYNVTIDGITYEYDWRTQSYYVGHSTGACGFDTTSGIKDVKVLSAIPASQNGSEKDIPVTKLYSGAFRDCTEITSVQLPNSVTTIGWDVFYGCTNLKSVNLPKGLTSMGPFAFSHCSSLTSVEIPGTLSFLPYAAFMWCDNLSEVKFGEGIEGIAEDAFQYCTSLKEAILPNSVDSIGRSAFNGCTALEKVTLGSGLHKIGDYVFSGCTSLAELTLPEELDSIGKYAFSDIAATSINIPASVKSIGSFAFYSKKLVSVYITDLEAWCKIDFENESSNPMYFAERLFLGGKLLRDLTFPKSLDVVKPNTFCGCELFTSVTLHDNIKSIGNYAFYKCSDIPEIKFPAKLKEIGKSAFEFCEKLPALILPSGLETIGERAFYFCQEATEIDLPASLKSVGENAFYSNPYNPSNVRIHDLSAWCSVQFTNDASNPMWRSKHLYLNDELVRNLEIPYGVKNIMPYAFIDGRFGKVTLPSTIESIGNSAFAGCGYITQVNFPKKVKEIGNYAFRNCSSLSTIVSLMDDPCKTGYDCFFNSGKSVYNNAKLYVPEGSTDLYEITSCWNEFKNIIEGVPTAIENVTTDDDYFHIYDLSGRRLNGKQRGLNILIDGSGKARKVTNR